ncbi:MAG: hypothetical protein J0L93_07765 [Deltaproteobacteria bacterium]|nr:hypothetical protein [Deltaproteobacteria bacterium]
MKTFILLSAILFSQSVMADDAPTAPAAPAAPTTTSNSQSGERTILIQESTGKKDSPAKVFVESGTEEISGSPEAGVKPAYRTWEQKCTEWKNELERRNGKNLLVVSCGSPKRTSERIQSDMSYTYHSTGKYKIKVLGK